MTGNEPKDRIRWDVLGMTTDIVTSFVSNNAVDTASLPKLIKTVNQTILELAQSGKQSQQNRPNPAVPISKSITDAHIICLEDGRKLKMLKRYLRTRYNLSPEAYRERWNLPSDYPMVAPDYAKRRSEFAKEIGLGKTKKP